MRRDRTCWLFDLDLRPAARNALPVPRLEDEPRQRMAFDFTIDVPANLIRETWTGRIDLAQLYESCRLEWAHPDYRRNMNMISDFRAAQIEITEQELGEFAQFMGQEEAVQRHAIVVRREAGFGLVKVFEMLSESTSPYWESLRVFFDYKNGEVWVLSGLPPLRSNK
jgi:hypothetical protein